MNKAQLEYGKQRLKEYADYYGIPDIVMAKILLDIHKIKDIYNWVDADYFLNTMVHGEPVSTNPKRK